MFGAPGWGVWSVSVHLLRRVAGHFCNFFGSISALDRIACRPRVFAGCIAYFHVFSGSTDAVFAWNQESWLAPSLACAGGTMRRGLFSSFSLG